LPVIVFCRPMREDAEADLVNAFRTTVSVSHGLKMH